MDKIIKLLILLLVLNSCSKNKTFDKQKDNIVFKYVNFIEINLRAKKIKVSYIGLEQTSSIYFSKNEYDLIIKSYNHNNIGDEKGIFDCFDDNLMMPNFNDEIMIYHSKKICFMHKLNSAVLKV